LIVEVMKLCMNLSIMVVIVELIFNIGLTQGFC
jgi:hypothetical protein